MPHHWLAACIAMSVMFLGAGPLAAQNEVADTAAADTTSADLGISPRGSMLRSLVVPGWGQATVGSYHRGAVFFALRGSAAYMLFKTLRKLDSARAVETRIVGLATDSLNALMAMDSAAAARLSNPLAFQEAVDSFPGLERMRGLVGSREQQRQDWIAYTIFFTLLDVIDAYVNAHFRDFPVSIESAPTPGGGGLFRFRIPVGWGGAGNARRPTPAAWGFPPGFR